MNAPLLVVVTGMPSSGKTTVAESLATRLRLPLVAKDDLKESLFETVGSGDVAWSGRLGDAAYDLMFALARTMLSASVSLIVEANFFVDQAARFESLPQHRLLQIHCAAPLPLLLERYAARERHPGHNDAEKIAELPARHASGAHAPLDVPGETIRLDTAEPVDIDAVAERLRALL
ncbi:MAG TPA: ATP-binding protein [Gaiellaceae bacterium]|nr:ATP-binding protein [Gaiellaceae bacterium]